MSAVGTSAIERLHADPTARSERAPPDRHRPPPRTGPTPRTSRRRRRASPATIAPSAMPAARAATQASPAPVGLTGARAASSHPRHDPVAARAISPSGARCRHDRSGAVVAQPLHGVPRDRRCRWSPPARRVLGLTTSGVAASAARSASPSASTMVAAAGRPGDPDQLRVGIVGHAGRQAARQHDHPCARQPAGRPGPPGAPTPRP